MRNPQPARTTGTEPKEKTSIVQERWTGERAVRESLRSDFESLVAEHYRLYRDFLELAVRLRSASRSEETRIDDG